MNWLDYVDQIVSNGWFQLGFLILTLAMIQLESYYAPVKKQPGWRRVVYWAARIYGLTIWVLAIIVVACIIVIVAFAFLMRIL